MKLSLLKSLALVSAMTFVACDLEGEVKKLEEEAINAAFESIKENAEKNGGTAAMVFPGKAVTLEVTDANSPLFGAKVVIEAGSLPSGIERAAATIQTPGSTPAIETDAHKFVGPFALVAMVGLPGGEIVVPAKPVSISLPYAAGETTPVEQVSLGVINTNGELKVVDGSSADDKFATGSTTELNIFAALWNVDYDGEAAPENSYVYKVVNADETVACVGLVDLTETFQGSISYDGTTDILNVTFGVLGALAYSITDNTIASPGPVDVDPTADLLTFTCNGTTYTAATIEQFTVVYSNIDPTAGTADVIGEVEFTDANGVVVKAAIEKTGAPVSWVD